MIRVANSETYFFVKIPVDFQAEHLTNIQKEKLFHVSD